MRRTNAKTSQQMTNEQFVSIRARRNAPDEPNDTARGLPLL